MTEKTLKSPTDEELINLALGYEFGGEAGGGVPREHYFHDEDVIGLIRASIDRYGQPAASTESDPENEHAAFEVWRKREYPWTSPATDGMGIVWDAWMERARRAAPVVQEPMDFEHRRALREGQRNAAEAEFFNARPKLNDTPYHVLFCAGFDRGWDAAPVAAREPAVNQWKCQSCGCEHGVAGEPYWTHDRTPYPVESIWRCDRCDATHAIKLIEPTCAAPVVAQPSVPEGWRLMPVYPTQSMRDAGKKALDVLKMEPGMTAADRAFYVFCAMLAAAPTPPAVERPDPEPWKTGDADLDKVLDLVENGSPCEPTVQAIQRIRERLAAVPAASAEILFWYRPRSDGGFDGPLHNSIIEEVRKSSGAWLPLFTGAYLTSPAVEQPNSDPCPWCMPGVFCKSPVCGRLAQAQERDDAERYRAIRTAISTGNAELLKCDPHSMDWIECDTPPSEIDAAIDAFRNAGGQS